MSSTSLPAFDITLESKVAFLRHPTSFPEPAYRVEAIETHMSWVFLTDGYAYKLKKPVCQEFFDFRTVEARHHYCQEEVRLNRRLAEDIYLGLVALSMDAHGHLQLDQHGTIVDWLVKMHRLPTYARLCTQERYGKRKRYPPCCGAAYRLLSKLPAHRYRPLHISNVVLAKYRA